MSGHRYGIWRSAKVINFDFIIKNRRHLLLVFVIGAFFYTYIRSQKTDEVSQHSASIAEVSSAEVLDEFASFDNIVVEEDLSSDSDEGNSSVSIANATIPLRRELFDQSKAYIRNDLTELSPDVDTLAAPGHPESVYIDALYALLGDYAMIVKEGGYPVGSNMDITNALLGKNGKYFALLPQDHPRINQNGELVDKWGTPYHFHLLSLHEIEIRSAGGDRKMYSSDDVLSQNFGRNEF